MGRLQKILVVDASRVVRATLAKHLEEGFEIIGEGNGESAWQVLMLDSAISLVISGLQIPKLDAHELLRRMRASSIRRIRDTPFVLVVSDLEKRADRDFDRAQGVAGFLTKTMKKAEILAGLAALFEVPASMAGKAGAGAAELVQAARQPSVATGSASFLDEEKFRETLSKLTFGGAQPEKFSVLVFGIDHRQSLIERFGVPAARMIAERFAALLLAKINSGDLLGRCHGERLVVVSRGVDLAHALRFGRKVCKSMASGQIVIRGEKVKLTASVGIASTSDDTVANPSDLLALAASRLDQAMVCGGNTVSTDYRPACPGHCQQGLPGKLFAALNAPGSIGSRNELAGLGLSLLPLLRLLDQELALEMPLSTIERQLQDAAKAD